MTTLWNGVLRRIRGLSAGAAVVLAAVGAWAQVAPVEGYWAVVVSPDAVMRSGDRDLYYPVARLAGGQLVHVDGEGGGWSRAAYPSGTAAFIPAEAVTLSADGKTATLTRAERPRAAKIDAAKAVGSWRTIGDAPLPAGTVLTLAAPGALEDAGGKTAYRVVAPESARGYVQSSALERATQQQIDEYLRKIGAATKTAEVPAVTGSAPEPSGTLAEAPAESAPVKPAEPSLLDRLDAAFKVVSAQPTEKAELTELIAEYEKALADIPDDPMTRLTRARLQQRIDVLKFRAEYQQQMLAMAEARPDVEEGVKRAAAALAELEKVRTYDAVGRLSTSTIYDGKRLPLMYRIQSVGSPMPRTIAYVRPDQLNLEAKVGRLVGVLGTASMDPDLKLKVIVPTRVDLLQAETGSEPAPAPPPGG